MNCANSFYLGVELTDELTVKTAKDLKKCTNVIQEFVLDELNKAIASKLSSSVSVLHQDYVGTLTRCLENLESHEDDDETNASASKALQEVIKEFFTFFHLIFYS
jgi:flagellar motor switch protein FliG